MEMRVAILFSVRGPCEAAQELQPVQGRNFAPRCSSYGFTDTHKRAKSPVLVPLLPLSSCLVGHSSLPWKGGMRRAATSERRFPSAERHSGDAVDAPTSNQGCQGPAGARGTGPSKPAGTLLPGTLLTGSCQE